MNEFQKNILVTLIDKYENSVLSKSGSNRNLSITLTTKDSILKKYDATDSYKYSEQYNHDIKELESFGYITACFDKHDKFQSLSLNLKCVNSVYSVIHRENPKAECIKYISFLESYECSGFLKEYTLSLINTINTKFRVPTLFSSIEEMKTIFDLIQHMQRQDEEIMERDFSIKYLKDSKLFSNFKNKVCRIIYEHNPDYPYADEEFDMDRILSYFNISKNSSTALIKNNLCFKINNQIIDLDNFNHVFYLSDEIIKDMKILNSTFKKVITIENLTTFKCYQDDDAIIIYLAGFNNHTKQMLLKKIYEKYPEKEYLHFSDIDCGGFLIFNHLVESTSIPFKPLHMDIVDLKQPGVVLKELTSNDKNRLMKMQDDDKFRLFKNVISYMLAINKKLEQEALDDSVYISKRTKTC